MHSTADSAHSAQLRVSRKLNGELLLKEEHITMKTLRSTERISPDEMTDAILRSGYLLERRVATVLGKAGYKVVTNRGFTDPEPDKETGKSREYDVLAFKDISVYGSGLHGIFPTLICECENNPQPIVFFVKEKQTFEPLIDEVRVSGVPSKIWEHNKFISVQKFTEVESFHHYCRPEVPVGSQYCSFQIKKDRSGPTWMAHHIDEAHKTLTTVFKALEFEINEDFRLWRIDEKLKREFIDLSFYYPMAIFQGEIYAAHMEPELRLEKCQHVQLNMEYFSFYENDIISYHIDVICEEYLPSYLEIIDLEMERVKRVLQQQKDKVQLSIDKIVERCKALEKEPESYRKYLEFDSSN